MDNYEIIEKLECVIEQLELVARGALPQPAASLSITTLKEVVQALEDDA